MLRDHAPFQRVTAGQSSAIDRQWMRMMNDVFENIGHEHLCNAGMHPREATELLGLVALNCRIKEE